MQVLPALTKPRFSLLHVGCLAIFVLTFFVATAVMNNWSDFKDGVRHGWANKSGTN
ncbi:MAG TPA: hypothetical protein VK181_00090 [Rhizobium sp.]|nr:hypothetical protein [Rhizobium sp.]